MHPQAAMMSRFTGFLRSASSRLPRYSSRQSGMAGKQTNNQSINERSEFGLCYGDGPRGRIWGWVFYLFRNQVDSAERPWRNAAQVL